MAAVVVVGLGKTNWVVDLAVSRGRRRREGGWRQVDPSGTTRLDRVAAVERKALVPDVAILGPTQDS